MHPFINEERKVIFWWSAKCGCTTVKSIMLESMALDWAFKRCSTDEESVRDSVRRLLYLKSKVNGSVTDKVVRDFLVSHGVNNIHCLIAGSFRRLNLAFAARYRNVLFVRDPFKRFVSGFMDKHIEGFFTKKFRPMNFLDGARNIIRLDRHHFSPQTSVAFLPNLRYEKVFDISAVDYAYLSSLLGMRVEPRAMHKSNPYVGECKSELHLAPYEELSAMKASGNLPDYDCFYDEESKRLVGEYYKGDIEFISRMLPST